MISSTQDQIQRTVDLVGTPCYVYDESLIKRNIERFTSIPYEPKAIRFATMANNNPELLRLLKASGIGVFVNSLKHLALAAECGFSADDIVFATTGLSEADMRYLHEKGIRLHLDSLRQIETFGAMASGGSCGVRLNVAERSPDNRLTAPQSRLGITPQEFPELLAAAARHRLRIVGVHVYLGTNVASEDELIVGARQTLEMADTFPDLEYVDLGGGFPVGEGDDSSFDYTTYATRITALLRDYSSRRGRPIRLVLEPGRALFGDTAVFCTRVLDVKERERRVFACCDGSVSLLPRPLFYGSSHPLSVLGKEQSPVLDQAVDIVGSTTYSRDYLARDLHLPEIAVGDILLFEEAGSYCCSMMSYFLGQQWPAEVLIEKNGALQVIREAERVTVRL